MLLHDGSLLDADSDEELTKSDVDLMQDVARGAFADMILDWNRNERYKSALQTVIERRKARGEYAHVVDIGTGSGLLSLAAAAVGADHVTAVEMFQPSAIAAMQTFARSSFVDRIELVTGRSNEIGSLPKKGNIIVAEVFDSELIGEGALRTFKEAHGTLVEKDANVVPASAIIWALPVESASLRRFNRHPKILRANDHDDADCQAFSAAFDFQASQLRPGVNFRPLGAPFVAFHFNFEDADSIRYEERRVVDFVVDPAACKLATDVPSTIADPADVSFQLDCVLLWWTLDMDGSGGDNTLTTAPTWMDANSVWRDHWMQVACFLPGAPHSIRLGDHLPLICHHDEFEFCFALDRGDFNKLVKAPARLNGCAFHGATSRTALCRMNEIEENANLLEALLHFSAGRHMIGVGTGTLALYAACHADSPTVTVVGVDRRCRQIYVEAATKFPAAVHFVDRCDQLDLTGISGDSGTSIAIVGDPYFSSSVRPWDDIWQYRRHCHDLRHRVGTLPLIDSFVRSMRLYAMPVKFDNLWKICASVKTALGFDLSHYNKIYQAAIRVADDPIETFSLWEYLSVATGQPYCVYRVDFDAASSDLLRWTCSACGSHDHGAHKLMDCDGGLGAIVYDRSETNAFVFWTEVQCYAGSCRPPIRLSGALFDLGEPMIGRRPQWSHSYRQGVYFMSRTNSDGAVNFSALSQELINY